MEYRLATTNDIEEMIRTHFNSVHAISTEVYLSQVLNAWSPEPSVERFEWLTGIVKSDNTCCYVAVDPDFGIVGFSVLLIGDCMLKALYIDPDYIGRGVGKTLLSMTLQQALNIGINSIQLKASLNSVSFYEKAGFSHVSDSSQELSNGQFMQSKTMDIYLNEGAQQND